MKSLLIALILAPLAAHAEGTNVRCSDASVTYNIISRGSFATEGTIVTIVANGILHTVIDSRVDSVDLSQPGKILVALTTINADGIADNDSGKATLELEVNDKHDGEPGQNANGKGHIHILKNPPRHPDNIIFRPDYDLENCVGTI